MKSISDYLNEFSKSTNIMYELSDKELQKLRLCYMDIYKDVEIVCKRHGLTIMAGFGTALGAIRHKGFIPWDDDFDVLMPRSDYNKFIMLFEKELSHKYILSVPGIGKESNRLYMQIIKRGTILETANDMIMERTNGISIDVFPIDKMPSNFFLRNIKYILIDGIRVLGISTSIYEKNSTTFKKLFCVNLEALLYYRMRWLIGLFGSIWGRQRLFDLHNRLSSSSNGNKYSSIPSSYVSKRTELPQNVYLPAKEVKFEDSTILIPNDSDAYLKKVYGDYMQLPPEDKREKHFYVKLDFGD